MRARRLKQKMAADEDLIDAAFEATKGDPTRRGEVLALVDQYRTACRLTRGPDKSRAKHWRGNVHRIEQKLDKLAGPTPLQRAIESECC